jgi:hypothetical protein
VKVARVINRAREPMAQIQIVVGFPVSFHVEASRSVYQEPESPAPGAGRRYGVSVECPQSGVWKTGVFAAKRLDHSPRGSKDPVQDLLRDATSGNS